MQHHEPLRDAIKRCTPAWWASTLDGEPDNVWTFWEAFWKYSLAIDHAAASEDTASEGTKLASCFYLMFIKLAIEKKPNSEELASSLGIADATTIGKYWRILLKRYNLFLRKREFAFTVYRESQEISIPLLYTFDSGNFFTLSEMSYQRDKGKIKVIRKRDGKDVTNSLPENKEEYEVELLDRSYEPQYAKDSEQAGTVLRTLERKLHVD